MAACVTWLVQTSESVHPAALEPTTLPPDALLIY
jgi:hypothetical protein